jgi:hypothetical protein
VALKVKREKLSHPLDGELVDLTTSFRRAVPYKQYEELVDLTQKEDSTGGDVDKEAVIIL